MFLRLESSYWSNEKCIKGRILIVFVTCRKIIFGLHGHSHGGHSEDEEEHKPSMSQDEVISRGMSILGII